MVTPLKFNFDTGFAMPGASKDNEPEEVTFTLQEMEQAKEKAYQDGHAAALAEALSLTENQIAGELQLLISQLGDMNKELGDKVKQIRAEAGRLALQIAGKLSPALIAKSPLAETQSLLDECLSHLSAAPHIVIRINEDLVKQLRKRVDGYIAERGFDGKIMILGEPDKPKGDCKIEWADGGIERDQMAMKKTIANAVERHILAMQAPATPGNPASEDEAASPPEIEGEH
jgi:flagellar assembly protein FliH